MMDSSDSRPHRTGSSGSSSSELFICFTSRLSSSSMKISSKSILSPGRGRDQQPLSLSNSLSRRLRTNGSMKGGQASPMFPTGGKKRGCAFENPEPSSPKVTCIGQVRVKTKKQGKKMRTLSKRRSSGDLSFRKVEQSQSRDGFNQSYQSNASNNQEGLNQRNQRWVHLPLTICEALRAFGAEFSCLLPCKSPCFSSSEREKEEKSAAGGGGENGGGQSSCGAVFARWLVAVQDGGGKEREIELVVGGEEESTMLRSQRRSLSRHVVEEEEDKWEVKVDEREVPEEERDEEEEEARVSICIPPKNALLLMRCRSDPVKMSALSNRLWESPVRNEEEEEEEEEEDDEDEEGKHNNGDDEEQVLNIEEIEVKEELSLEEDEGCQVCEELISNEAFDEQENPETETNLPLEVQEEEEEEELEIWKEEQLEIEEKQENEVLDLEVAQTVVVEGNAMDETGSDQEKLEKDEVELIQEQIEEDSSGDYSVLSDLEVEDKSELVSLPIEAALEEEPEKSTEDHQRETPQETLLEEDEEEKVTVEREEEVEETHEEEVEEEEKEQEQPHSEVERESHEVVVVVKKQERESSVLPDCLLLMMCEPKLSMEVSKETWVCSTDFIRCLPERHVTTKDGVDHDHDHEQNKKGVSTGNSNPSLPTQPAHHNHQQLQQPPRSSCSFPAPAAGVSMASMIEQKLVNSAVYEPFVLTRCKSEPMRTAAKLAPEACFWKNRKLEPHRNATFGIGAAGVGF